MDINNNNDSNETDSSSLYPIDYCSDDACYDRYYYATAYAAYYGVGSIYLVIGATGRCLLLCSMIGQMKIDSGFVYQVMVVANESVSDLFVLIYLILWVWLRYVDAYRRCYPCVWLTVKLSLLGYEASNQSTVVLLIATAVDRLCALRRPAFYRNLDQKQTQIAAVVVSALLGVSISVFDCFRYKVVRTSDGYEPDIVDETPSVFLHLRDSLRLCCLALLLFFTCLLIRSIRRFDNNKLINNVKLLPESKRDDDDDDDDQAAKRLVEITLIRLTIAQCSTYIVSSSFQIVFYALQYTDLADCQCGMDVAGAVFDGVYYLSEMINFVCLITLNNRSRLLLCETVRRFGASLRRLINRDSTEIDSDSHLYRSVSRK